MLQKSLNLLFFFNCQEGGLNFNSNPQLKKKYRKRKFSNLKMNSEHISKNPAIEESIVESPSPEDKSDFDFSAFGSLDVINRVQHNYQKMSVDFSELQSQQQRMNRDFNDHQASSREPKKTNSNKKSLEKLFRKEEEIRQLKKQVKTPDPIRRDFGFRNPYYPYPGMGIPPIPYYNGYSPSSWNFQDGNINMAQPSPSTPLSTEGTTRIREDSVSSHEYEKNNEKIKGLKKQINELKQKNQVLKEKFNWWSLILIWMWLISLLAMLALL